MSQSNCDFESKSLGQNTKHHFNRYCCWSIKYNHIATKSQSLVCSTLIGLGLYHKAVSHDFSRNLISKASSSQGIY